VEKLTRVVPTISTAEIEENAHDAFKRYRASYPIAILETGGYVVLRHADVSRLSEDSRLSATGTAIPAHGGITQGALFDIFQHGMLTANGHDHQRRRRAISRAVAGEVIGEFRNSVRKAAHKLIDGYHQVGEVELGSAYAAKLPILALAGMLGLPDFEVSAFMRDIDQMNEFFRPDASPAAIGEAEFAAKRVQEFLKALLASKRKGQSGDFLSRYLAMLDADQDVSDTEAIIQLVQLIIGGTESVRVAMVAQTANLLSSRAQWEAVCENPALASSAVSEALRFEPGIAGVVRISTDDIDIDGWIIPAGQMVILSSMSALRDERMFDQPDCFNIFRSDLVPSHLAFGGGAHKCVAEALGRAELEEGLSVLAERLPSMMLKARPTFIGHVFVRRTTECRVTW